MAVASLAPGGALVRSVVQATQSIWTHPQGPGTAFDLLEGGLGNAEGCLPLEEIVSRDLGTGVLNRLLQVEGSLTLAGVGSTGADEHAYFFLSNFRSSLDGTEATVHYPAFLEGGVVLRSACVRLGLGKEASLREKYREIDLEVLKIIRSHGMGKDLFRGATRRVTFSHHQTGQVYKAYHKFGPSLEAESHGRSLLRFFGLEAPRMIESSLPGGYWIEHAEGDLLKDIIQWCRRYRYSFIDWIDAYPERAARMAFELGRQIAVLYVLGNEDFHDENVVVTQEGHCRVIDLETLGVPAWIALQSKSQGRYVSDAINRNFANHLFSYWDSRDRKMVWFITEGFADRLLEGAMEVFQKLRNPSFQKGLIASARQDFLARAVIRPTDAYQEDLGFGNIVPHYTFRVSGDAFADFVQCRIDLLNQVTRRQRAYCLSEPPALSFKYSKKRRRDQADKI